MSKTAPYLSIKIVGNNKPLLKRLIWLGDCGGLAILGPMSAAAFDCGAAFGVGGICRERDSGNTLQAIAATAETHKIFGNHCTAVGFCDEVATFVGVPRSAGGAAVEARKGGGADGGGDFCFLGHGAVPFVSVTLDIEPDTSIDKGSRELFYCVVASNGAIKLRSRFVHGLFAFCSRPENEHGTKRERKNVARTRQTTQ